MFKAHKWICNAIIYFVILVIVITGCSQKEKNESTINKEPVGKESIQETVAPDSTQKENLAGSTEVKLNSDTDNTDNSSTSQQKQESSEVKFTFYPSGPDFIKSIIDKRGSVEITNEMRERFNLFAKDYRFEYLPGMNYYESFFDANEYAKSFGYNNFGYAVFYVLAYMRYEKISDEDMQNAIQSLFVAKESYKDMPQQAYRKLAKYENGYYSPCPEGTPDFDRMFYLLTGLDIVQDESKGIFITIKAKNYYFNDSSYEPGINEKWLAEKAKEMGISDMEAATKLISNGKMSELKSEKVSKTKIYIKFNGQNPESYNPRFVSSNTLGNEPNE